MYEGGTCTPLVVHYPAGLKTKAGAVTNEVGHVMDVMATCLELAGATCPEEFDGRAITSMQGRSLVPVFRDEKPAKREMLAWEHIGTKAIRMGDWKLVARRNGPWSLYDLSVDRSEQKDVAGKHADRVRQMEQCWQQWARETQVLPAPGK
jgi:arylsulfatase